MLHLLLAAGAQLSAVLNDPDYCPPCASSKRALLFSSVPVWCCDFSCGPQAVELNTSKQCVLEDLQIMDDRRTILTCVEKYAKSMSFTVDEDLFSVQYATDFARQTELYAHDVPRYNPGCMKVDGTQFWGAYPDLAADILDALDTAACDERAYGHFPRVHALNAIAEAVLRMGHWEATFSGMVAASRCSWTLYLSEAMLETGTPTNITFMDRVYHLDEIAAECSQGLVDVFRTCDLSVENPETGRVKLNQDLVEMYETMLVSTLSAYLLAVGLVKACVPPEGGADATLEALYTGSVDIYNRFFTPEGEAAARQALRDFEFNGGTKYGSSFCNLALTSFGAFSGPFDTDIDRSAAWTEANVLMMEAIALYKSA